MKSICQTLSILAFLALAASGVLGASAQAQGASDGPGLSLDTFTSADIVRPGGQMRILAEVRLEEGWHVNAHEPAEDYLIPTELTFTEVPVGITVTRTIYPEHTTFTVEGWEEPLLVYESGFPIGAIAEIGSGVEPGDYTLKGRLQYQACNDKQCIQPMEEPVEVKLTVAGEDAEPSPQHAEKFAALDWGGEAAGPSEPQGGTEVQFTATSPVSETTISAANGPKLQVKAWPQHDEEYAPDKPIRLAIEIVLDEGWHVNAHVPSEDYLIPTVIEFDKLPEGLTVERLFYPEAKQFTFSFSDEPLDVYEGRFGIGAELTADESVKPGNYTLVASLRYQACNDTQCLAPNTGSIEVPVTIVEPSEAAALGEGSPSDDNVFALVDWSDAGTETEGSTQTAQAEPPADGPAGQGTAESGDWKTLIEDFTIANQAGGYMEPAPFLQFIEDAETGQGDKASVLETAGLIGRIGLTLLGGLVLNLTPCVLPLIPINLAIIGAGARAKSRLRGFSLGGVYGLGIALVFGILGLIVVLGLGSFGAGINSSFWFNAIIAAFFVALGLAMFDVFAIDFSKFQSKLTNSAGGNGTFYFAFFMGGVSALLAGACVAPLLIAVLLYSQSVFAQGNVEGLILPFILGIGMALPWPVAGAGITMLPKPGLWMNKVKYVLGVFIIGLGIYYGSIAYGLFEQQYLVDRDAVQASVAEFDEEGWTSSLSDGLARAKAEDKPVLIDFWATWCKNCLVMNKTTFKDEEVVAKLDDYVKVKYQAEDPSAPPASELLSRFDEYVGLPFYVVLQPE